MESLTTIYNTKNITLNKYDESDEALILEPLWVWKVACILNEKNGSRRPPLPEDFSEPMVSYICGLHHKQGRGPDAFLLNQDNEIIKSIEIKATITESGFQEVKNEQYDELYWLRFHEHEKLKYEIYKFPCEKIEQYLQGRNNRKINLINLIGEIDKPIAIGRIGIMNK
jgi:hypothetical protein